MKSHHCAWHVACSHHCCEDWGYRYLAASAAKTTIYSADEARRAFVDGSYLKLEASATKPSIRVEVFVGKCVVSGVIPMLLHRLNLEKEKLPGLSCLQDDLNPKAARDLALSLQINVSTSNRIFLMFDEVRGRSTKTVSDQCNVLPKSHPNLHGMTLGGPTRTIGYSIDSTQTHCVF